MEDLTVDEAFVLLNYCTNLVASKKHEAFPCFLLTTRQAGEWVGVSKLCQQLGLDGAGLKSDLFAAWLPDPLHNEAYVVIIFYNEESKWNTAAHYNRQRLLLTQSEKTLLRTAAGYGS